MLTSVYIKNFAIIDEVEIDFDKGMSVLSGETGAGKSILIDAIGLVLGNKNKKNSSSKNSEVSCHFKVSNKNILENLLEQGLINKDENLCIFRHSSNEVSSKFYINDKAVTKTKIKEIGNLLIDIHGQHEHQLILSKDEQLRRLDNYICKEDLLTEVRELYKTIRLNEKNISNILENMDTFEERIALLGHEVHELESNLINKLEYENMMSEISRLTNADEIKNLSNETSAALFGDDENNIYNKLSIINKKLSDVVNMDPTSKSIYDESLIILEQIQNLSKSISKYEQSIDIDHERLEAINNKIILLNNIFRKYSISEDNMEVLLEEKKKNILELKEQKLLIDNWEREKSQCSKKYNEKASKLSMYRKKESTSLEKKIIEKLKLLNMGDCEFKINITTDESLISKNGFDKIEFLIKTNKKSELLPISQIASGGELSRISLVIQLETRSNSDSGTMIFDEVDTGIGGATSEILGNYLKDLSNSSQVFCVTHQAQIAAKANNHYLVKKDVNSVSTEVIKLEKKDRLNEIARMIGGVKLTDKTLQYANEILSD